MERWVRYLAGLRILRENYEIKGILTEADPKVYFSADIPEAGMKTGKSCSRGNGLPGFRAIPG